MLRFQVKEKTRKAINKRKREIEQRLDRGNFPDHVPVFSTPTIDYEIAERVRGVSAGGLGVLVQVAKRLQLDEAINRRVPIFKLYAPYTESDHVLNMAFNILAGGTCLEHLELRRHDAAYMDALGATRIPDPTTAGDFCRRFDEPKIHALMETMNEKRREVWQAQPDSFLEEAVIDADGTMVTTLGERKEGIDINHKGEWGYHPLVVSLANTGEAMYLVNRSGNRPSHEGAGDYLNLAIHHCVEAGFRKIKLRGDTDFSQTQRLDGWHDRGITFVFGFDATPKLYEMAEELPETAWKRLVRPAKYEVKTKPRRRRPNVKQKIVEQREFMDKRTVTEHVAEFRYRPGACRREYRVVVVWKEQQEWKGQQRLFDTERCFFYITNDMTSPMEAIVWDANRRCNQENTIEQHKNGVHALTAPLDSLVSNWAYMVIASLAWTLKAWCALLIPVEEKNKKQHEHEKQRLLRMEFHTFRNAFINIFAQIVRTGRKLIYRFIGWTPWLDTFFRLFDHLRRPLRC